MEYNDLTDEVKKHNGGTCKNVGRARLDKLRWLVDEVWNGNIMETISSTGGASASGDASASAVAKSRPSIASSSTSFEHSPLRGSASVPKVIKELEKGAVFNGWNPAWKVIEDNTIYSMISANRTRTCSVCDKT